MRFRLSERAVVLPERLVLQLRKRVCEQIEPELPAARLLRHQKLLHVSAQGLRPPEDGEVRFKNDRLFNGKLQEIGVFETAEPNHIQTIGMKGDMSRTLFENGTVGTADFGRKQRLFVSHAAGFQPVQLRDERRRERAVDHPLDG